ncbi:hypothetical protein MFAL_21880 [Mycolicibacterium fallax]|nr:hypothetical protein MFAL_21880 [Mycolicibacterium fallax]
MPSPPGFVELPSTTRVVSATGMLRLPPGGSGHTAVTAAAVTAMLIVTAATADLIRTPPRGRRDG